MSCRPLSACTLAGVPARLWTCDSPWDWATLLTYLSTQDERELSVRMLAQAFEGIPRAEQPAAVQQWVQNNVRFVPDSPPERLRAWLDRLQAGKPGEPFERFAGPAETIARGAGDCDDSARVVRAVLRALGHDAKLVFMGTKDSPVHVVTAIKQPSGRFWLEATMHARPGEHPTRAKERIDADH